MSQATAIPRASARGADSRTARLLAAGTVAGPLFVAVWASQAYTRAGFGPARHPLSLLSLGSFGWVQIANFIVAGVLTAACAVGLHRAIDTGPGATWGPRLVGGFGMGLVVAGVFVTDAGAGFPPGAPSGAPAMSWHGALHEFGYAVAVVSWTVACFVFRRRYARSQRPQLARVCVATFAVVLALSVWPDSGSFGIRILLASAVQFAFVAAVAASHVARIQRDARHRTADSW